MTIAAPSRRPRLQALIEQAWRRARRRQLLWAALVLIAAIAAVSLYFTLPGGGGQGGPAPTQVQAGKLEPARFSAGDGWYVGSHCQPAVRHPARGCAQTAAWASTIPWRDCWNCFPHRTLAALPPNGVAIMLALNPLDGLTHARRFHWPPRIPPSQLGYLEGEGPSTVSYALGDRLGPWGAELWVFFGRVHPAKAEITRAEEELRSAQLPSLGSHARRR